MLKSEGVLIIYYRKIHHAIRRILLQLYITSLDHDNFASDSICVYFKQKAILLVLVNTLLKNLSIQKTVFLKKKFILTDCIVKLKALHLK